MVVILRNFSFQLARCMLNFRDAGIKTRTPIHSYYFNSDEKNLTYNFGNDFYFQNRGGSSPVMRLLQKRIVGMEFTAGGLGVL